MGIWIWKVATVLQLLVIHMFSEAEGVAESSFISSRAQDENLYSVRYDLIDEYGSKSLSNLPESNPFHEVYSLKGKDGEIQRIHYATDNKGFRANFHSTAVNMPQNFIPVSQQSPFTWPVGSNLDKPSIVSTNRMLFPNMMPLGYASNAASQRETGERFPDRSVLLNPMSVTEKKAIRLGDNQKARELTKPLIQAPLSQNTFAVYPAIPNKQTAVPVKKPELVAFSNQINAPYQVELSETPNTFKEDLNSSPEVLYANTVKDLLRLTKPVQTLSLKSDKEKISSEVKLSKKSIASITKALPLPVNFLANINQLDTAINIPPNKQTNSSTEKILHDNSSTTNISKPIPPKRKTLPSWKNTQGKLAKISLLNSKNEKSKVPMKTLKPSLELEKLDLISSSSPMSTVFDISTNNGRYYHYILNMVKPTEKSSIIKSKYFSTGNALLKLLNETGVSFEKNDFQFSKAENIRSQNVKEKKINSSASVKENNDSSANMEEAKINSSANVKENNDSSANVKENNDSSANMEETKINSSASVKENNDSSANVEEDKINSSASVKENNDSSANVEENKINSSTNVKENKINSSVSAKENEIHSSRSVKENKINSSASVKENKTNYFLSESAFLSAEVNIKEPSYLNSTNSTDNTSEYKLTSTDKTEEKTTKESTILKAVTEDSWIQTSSGQFTTESNTEFPLSSTTEAPSSMNIESTTQALFLEFNENNKTDTTDTVQSTETPAEENLTEEIEMAPLFITMPKSPLNMLLVPVNWLYNIENKTEVGVDINDNTVFNGSTTIPVQKLADSTTSSAESHGEYNYTEAYDSSTEPDDVTTTTPIPTTIPPVTTTVGSTLVNEKSTTTEFHTETITSTPSVVPEENTEEFSNAQRVNSTSSKSGNSETDNLITENSPETENTTTTTKILAEPSVAITANHQTLNSTSPMIIIQVSDMNEFISRIHNLASELITTPENQDIKNNTRSIEDIFENRTEMVEISHSNASSVNKVDIFKNLSISSPMESHNSFQKQPPDFQLPAAVEKSEVKRIVPPSTKYSLVHPVLLENGATSFLRFSPNGIQEVSEIYASSNGHQYPTNSKSGLIEFILRSNDLNLKQGKHSQIPEIPNQLQRTISWPGSFGDDNGDIYPQSGIVISDVYGDKSSIQSDKFNYGNSIRQNHLQNNPQIAQLDSFGDVKGNIYPESDIVVSDLLEDKNSIQSDRFSYMRDTRQNSFHSNPQISQIIDTVHPDYIAIDNEENTFADYMEKSPAVYSENNKSPEGNQIFEEIFVDTFDGKESNPGSLDLTYVNPYLDILRLNGSNSDNSLIPEIEVVEYVPVDALGNNFELNSMADDTSNLYAQNPVYILEEYSETPKQRQDSEINVLDEVPLNSDIYASSANFGEDLPMAVIEDSAPVYGTRLQERVKSEDANQQSNNGFNQFQQSTSLSRAPWMN